jgi:hypothetical protein
VPAKSKAQPLHPALQQRAQAVKAAHAHLKANIPNFARLPGRDQIQHAQRHATRMLKRTSQ